jgi:ABC-type transport system substrate-binding protein
MASSRTEGESVTFSLKTNADNAIRVGMSNFIRDDLAKVGIRVVLTPVDFNTLITNLAIGFPVRRDSARPSERRAADPGNAQNVLRSSGETHNWFIRQQKPATPQEARIDRCWTRSSPTRISRAEGGVQEIQTIVNEQSWMIWLPILKVKLPVNNRFGNVQPSILAHRLLWNVERIYVKPSRES